MVLLDVPRSLPPSEVARWLIDRIEALEPPIDLAGHSLGALVSVRVAAMRPELVRRLVLIAPPGLRPRSWPIAYGWPLISSLARCRPAFLARLTSDALRAGPINLVRGGLHVSGTDIGDELSSVTAPTLLVWGARDRVVPTSDAPHWLDRLPNGRLLVIPSASHVPMYEAPHELGEAIVAFREERLDESCDKPRM